MNTAEQQRDNNHRGTVSFHEIIYIFTFVATMIQPLIIKNQ